MNKQFYEQLLAKFVKANKERKLYLAKKAGYENGEAYKTAIMKMIKEAIPSTELISEDISELDMVIAFDTTGSMSCYIEAVKNHITELIPRLFSNSPRLRMKIVAFGDYCDMENKNIFGNAYQESNLSSNQDELIHFVNNAKNTNGGDINEFYELVIKKIIEETPWRASAKKSVLFIADDYPHQIGYTYLPFIEKNQIDWKQEAIKAKDLGIQFDTLKIHKLNTWLPELSSITKGVSLDFKSSENTDKIIEGLTYARSNTTAYMAYTSTITDSGDEELIGAVKTMSTLL